MLCSVCVYLCVCVCVAALSIIQCAVSLQLGVKLSCQRCLHNFPITEVDADGAWRPLGGSPRRLPARIAPAIHQHTSRAQSTRQTLSASRQHGQPSTAYCCLGWMQREWVRSPSKNPQQRGIGVWPTPASCLVFVCMLVKYKSKCSRFGRTKCYNDYKMAPLWLNELFS